MGFEACCHRRGDRFPPRQFRLLTTSSEWRMWSGVTESIVQPDESPIVVSVDPKIRRFVDDSVS